MTEAALAPLQRAQQLAGGAATAAVVGAILIALAAVAKGASPALEALAEQQVTFDLAGILAALCALALFVAAFLPPPKT